MVLRPLLEARRARRTPSPSGTRPLPVREAPPMAEDASPVLRVAHFSDTYVPRRDGIVTAVQTLTAAMAEAGHSSLTVVPRHPDQPDDPGLLRLASVPCGVAQFRLAAWPRNRHVERIAQWLPNVVHVHTPGPVGLLGVLTARRLGLPLVQTYHTDLHAYAEAYRIPTKVVQGLLRAYARRLGSPKPTPARDVPRSQRRDAVVDACTDLLYGEADAVLVPTPAILTRYRLPVGEERIHLAPAGITLPKVSASARLDFRSRYGIGADEPTVLFVGRVNREKGIDLLAEAFGKVAVQVARARLVLVGAVYDQRWVNRLLSQAGITERTVVTRQLPPEEVAEAYAAADLFAFPSLTDTQGLVVQEAALAGLPAVLADPALHSSGPLAGSGVLAEADPDSYADAIIGLLTDADRRVRLGREAQALAEENTPATYARRMEEIYLQAMQRAASAVRLHRESRRLPFLRRLTA